MDLLVMHFKMNMYDFDLNRNINNYMMSTTSDESEEFEVECFCGKPAQLRKSYTAKNPGRLFYNCPKRRGKVK